MTDWRLGTAFFLATGEEGERQWLARTTRLAGLPNLQLDQLPDGHVLVRTRWVDMIAEARLVNGRSHRLLTIGYLGAEFLKQVDRPDWWTSFCRQFARTCEALCPIAAFVLTTPTTDLPDTLLAYEQVVSAGDGALLTRHDFALLYLSPPLDLRALDEFPELLVEGFALDGGGRIAVGSDVLPFPDD